MRHFRFTDLQSIHAVSPYLSGLAALPTKNCSWRIPSSRHLYAMSFSSINILSLLLFLIIYSSLVCYKNLPNVGNVTRLDLQSHPHFSNIKPSHTLRATHIPCITRLDAPEIMANLHYEGILSANIANSRWESQ